MRPGDIIYADRGNYRHFGIYAGNGRAVHYAYKGSASGLRTQIKETPLGVFAKGNDVCVWRVSRADGLSCYSREETLRRARSMVGVKNYNLLFNNCEHFAFWCKTGVSRSGQVELVVADVVLTIATPVLKILDAVADGFYALAAIL
jgi:cell wall-associated NlpC family hydrolase